MNAPSKGALSASWQKRLLRYQQDEVTGSALYTQIARREKHEGNRATLLRFAQEEQRHAEQWQSYTGRTLRPQRGKLWRYALLSHLFGYSFAIKLLEKNEALGAAAYRQVVDALPEAAAIIAEEEAHEQALLALLDEERLQYVGAMVLGLNDALVELTGALAGLTFALASSRYVALSGIITGSAATLSMAASNYLAERAEENPHALKSSLYTGIAYLITVVLMILPYLLFPDALVYAAFATMLAVVVLIIFCFNYYIAIAKGLPFLRRFGEMAGISLGVALISFLIGLAAKALLGVEI